MCTVVLVLLVGNVIIFVHTQIDILRLYVIQMCFSPPPSWPAVICKDPEEDWELVETDEDKDKIHMYHVIFLGKTKSRAWVPDDKVRVDVCAVGVRAWVPDDKVRVDVSAVGVGVSVCVLWVWVGLCVVLIVLLIFEIKIRFISYVKGRFNILLHDNIHPSD